MSAITADNFQKKQGGNINIKSDINRKMEVSMKNEKELSRDTKWIIGTTIAVAIVTTFLLGVIYVAQPFLSTNANRHDSNGAMTIRNDVLLSEFKSNQEKFNLAMEVKIDKLATKEDLNSVKDEILKTKNELKSDMGRIDEKLDLLLSKQKQK